MKIFRDRADSMYCRFCGKIIPADSLYCQFCGKSIQVTVQKHQKAEDEIDNPIPSPTNPYSRSLIDFAKENGTLQLVKAADRKGNLLRIAIFTKETKVLLSETIEEFSPIDIANKKDKLCVYKTPNGDYIMDWCLPDGEISSK